MNDRAMSGSSLVEGRAELLVHRRVFGDDQKGMYDHIDEYSDYGFLTHVETELAV